MFLMYLSIFCCFFPLIICQKGKQKYFYGGQVGIEGSKIFCKNTYMFIYLFSLVVDKTHLILYRKYRNTQYKQMFKIQFGFLYAQSHLKLKSYLIDQGF